MNNPLKYIDPDGCSTWVMQNSDGTYRVVGGDKEDKDYNIYVYNIKDGKLARGESIGVTNSTTSFYNDTKDENGKEFGWMGTINPNDKSGENYLNGIIGDTPSLSEYMPNKSMILSERMALAPKYIQQKLIFTEECQLAQKMEKKSLLPPEIWVI